MKKSAFLTVLWVVVAAVAFGLKPESTLAQRGGHGGGGGHIAAGGFHGGGGYAHAGGRYYGGYRGGSYYGTRGGYYGYHGSAYYGWRGGYYGGYHGGGYYGWRGAHWGYPGYAYGWGFGIGFGWGPYWASYGYPFSYGPWWGSPYYYPYVRYGYPGPYGASDDPPQNPEPTSPDLSPAKPSRTPPQERYPDANSGTSYLTASRSAALLHSSGGTTRAASTDRLAHYMTQPVSQPRQEVLSAIRALRDMPPYAFQRRIDSGRYRDFSPAERELVNNASPFPLNWEKPLQSVAARTDKPN